MTCADTPSTLLLSMWFGSGVTFGYSEEVSADSDSAIWREVRMVLLGIKWLVISSPLTAPDGVGLVSNYFGLPGQSTRSNRSQVEDNEKSAAACACRVRRAVEFCTH